MLWALVALGFGLHDPPVYARAIVYGGLLDVDGKPFFFLIVFGQPPVKAETGSVRLLAARKAFTSIVILTWAICSTNRDVLNYRDMCSCPFES